jgi:hypothetical protein
MMRLRWIVACLLAALATAPAGAAESGRTVSVSTTSGLLLMAGPEVLATDRAVKRLFAAGGTVDLRSVAAQDVVVAGGRVSLKTAASKAVIAAGADLEILDPAVDDVVAAGAQVRLRGGDVRGDAVLVGAHVDLAAPVAGDVIAAGNTVALAGTIAGNVSVSARRILLAPGTRIGGTLTYRSPQELLVPEGVEIAGGVTRGGWEERALRMGENAQRRLGLGLALAFGALIMLILFVAVPTAVAPNLLRHGADGLRERPLAAFGLGVLLALLTPAIMVALAVTLIGIPLAVLLGAVFLLMLAFAFLTASLGVGWALRQRRLERVPALPARQQILWTGIGAFVLLLIGIVPLLGGLVRAVVVLAALGAAARTLWATRAATPGYLASG